MIPEKYEVTKLEDNFLWFVSGSNDQDRFFRNGDHKRNGAIEEIISDGTFKVVPHPFYQLYSIHVNPDSTIIPVLYALLTRKSERAYVRLLDAVEQIIPSASPEYRT